MAEGQGDRAAAWTEHVDQLCDEGETVRHRADLEAATLVVTNRRLLAFTPDRRRSFRAVDRPNVGTVTVESTDRPAWLGLSLASTFVGVGLLEATDAVALGDLVPDGVPSPSDVAPAADLVGAVREGVAAALFVLEWGAVALAVAALVLAVVLAAAYVRSRSRRLVIRVRGGGDLAVPVTDAAVEDGVVAALEAAIRPDPVGETRAGRAGESDGASPEESG